MHSGFMMILSAATTDRLAGRSVMKKMRVVVLHEINKSVRSWQIEGLENESCIYTSLQFKKGCH